MSVSSKNRLRGIARSWRRTRLDNGQSLKCAIIPLRVTVMPDGHGYIERLNTEDVPELTRTDVPEHVIAKPADMGLCLQYIVNRGYALVSS